LAFIIRIYHDARSSEFQKGSHVKTKKFKKVDLFFTVQILLQITLVVLCSSVHQMGSAVAHLISSATITAHAANSFQRNFPDLFE